MVHVKRPASAGTTEPARGCVDAVIDSPRSPHPAGAVDERGSRETLRQPPIPCPRRLVRDDPSPRSRAVSRETGARNADVPPPLRNLMTLPGAHPPPMDGRPRDSCGGGSRQDDKDLRQCLCTVCATLWTSRFRHQYETPHHGEQLTSRTEGHRRGGSAVAASVQVSAIFGKAGPCCAGEACPQSDVDNYVDEPAKWCGQSCGRPCAQPRRGTSERAVPVRVDRRDSPRLRVIERSPYGRLRGRLRPRPFHAGQARIGTLATPPIPPIPFTADRRRRNGSALRRGAGQGDASRQAPRAAGLVVPK